METYFAAPWTDTPDAHASTYAAQLNERQLECVDFDVFISDATKTILFVGQMDKIRLSEPKFIDNYENTPDKQWTMVVKLFAKKYDREMRRIKREEKKRLQKHGGPARNEPQRRTSTPT